MKLRSIFIFFGVLIGLGYLGYVLLQTPIKNYALDREAKSRIEAILKGFQSSGVEDKVVGNEQTAICLWAEDIYLITNGEILGKASDNFDRWRKEKGIFPRIKDFKIVDAKRIDGITPETVLVTVEIDGQLLAMRVPKGHQVTWDDVPIGTTFAAQPSGQKSSSSSSSSGNSKTLGEKMLDKKNPKKEPAPKPIRQTGPNTFSNE